MVHHFNLFNEFQTDEFAFAHNVELIYQMNRINVLVFIVNIYHNCRYIYNMHMFGECMHITVSYRIVY